ncbi:hypothetical protein RI367_005646 [Sorochytrium milnesiophthora]
MPSSPQPTTAIGVQQPLPTKDTPWNQHHGVGTTLLANWVEERAVGAERVFKERNVKFVSERGHIGILKPQSPDNPDEAPCVKFTTVSREAYKLPVSEKHPLQPSVGKLKTMKERQWKFESIAQLERPVLPTPNIYRSTTAATYHYHNADEQGEYSPLTPKSPLAQSDAPETPVTFWSQQITRGAHTVYASVPHGVHPQADADVKTCVVGYSYTHGRRSQAPQSADVLDRVRHGRHVDFSTPITEYLKAPTKS